MAKDKPQKKYSLSEKRQIVTTIADMYADGSTIESCCDSVGIAFRTFYNWTKENAELAGIYSAARNTQAVFFKEKLRPKSYKSLERLIEGYTYEETKVTGTTIVGDDGKKVFVPKSVEKTTKTVHPNVTAVIYSIQSTSSFSPDFVQKNKLDITSNGNTIPGVVVLPQAEIDKLETKNPIDSLLENAEE